MSALVDQLKAALAFVSNAETLPSFRVYEAGRRDERLRTKAIDQALCEVVEAAEGLGLQCCNIGNYGPLKLAPGECRCSTCTMRIAKERLRAALEGRG